MTTKSDTYNYTQNPLGGGNYTTITAAGLRSTASGAKASSAATQDNASAWSASNYAFANDQTSAVVHGSTLAYDNVGTGVRLSTTGGGQGYIAYLEAAVPIVSLWILAAGTTGSDSSQRLIYWPVTVVSGSALELDIAATTLTVKYSGATLGTVTDSTYASGQPGPVYQPGNTNSSLITSFSATDATGAGIVVSPPAGAVTEAGNSATVISGFNTVIQTFVARRAGIVAPTPRKIFLPSRVRRAA